MPFEDAADALAGAWEFGYRHVDAIEVWNGRWTLDDEVALAVWDRLLRRGRRIIAVAGSDSHADIEPVGRPQVAVHADRLSSAAIVEGLVRCRCYLAESAEVGLAVMARSGQATAGPGDDIAVPAGPGIEIVAAVTGAPRSSLTVRTAAGVVAATRRTSTVAVSCAGTPRMCPTGTRASRCAGREPAGTCAARWWR